MSALKDSDAVAEALRDDPPRLDDLAKARMEKRLLEAARGPRTKAAEPSRRGVGGWIAGGLAVAAAVLLAVFAFRDAEPEPSTRVARMELRGASATRQSGTIDEGSSLRTRADETAEIRIEDSVVHLEPSTEVRLETLSADRMAFALARGEVRVEFHPRARGHEGMTVRTGRATVEVVGTVFTVRETGPSTEVSVTEGVVRVVPLGGEARSVAAGESTRVDERRAEAAPAVAPPDEAVEPMPEVEPAAPPPETERERRAQSPAQRLARARRLVAEGDNEGAEALLRGVVRASDASGAIRAQAATLLGDLLQRGGDLPGAADAYETAARQRAGHLSHLAIYDLARMQERRQGDREAARASYQRYLDESGNGPLAGQARQALCRLGDPGACPSAEPSP